VAEILAGVPEDEQAKIVCLNTTRVYNFDVARLTAPCLKSQPLCGWSRLSPGWEALSLRGGREDDGSFAGQ
jgi:hypothetical protein